MDKVKLAKVLARCQRAKRLLENEDFQVWYGEWEARRATYLERLGEQNLNSWQTFLMRGIIRQIRRMFSELEKQARELEHLTAEEEPDGGGKPVVFPGLTGDV